MTWELSGWFVLVRMLLRRSHGHVQFEDRRVQVLADQQKNLARGLAELRKGLDRQGHSEQPAERS